MAMLIKVMGSRTQCRSSCIFCLGSMSCLVAGGKSKGGRRMCSTNSRAGGWRSRNWRGDYKRRVEDADAEEGNHLEVRS